MPTLVESQNINSGSQNTNPLTTNVFTPSNGQVIVAKVTTWDQNVSAGVVTGGNQVWTKVKEAKPGVFAGYAAVYSCTVNTSLIGGDGSMTVTGAGPASSARHALQYERWDSAILAVTPASNPTINGAGGGLAALSSITPIGNNSIISAVLVDVSSLDPAGHAYHNAGVVEEAVWDGHIGSNSVHYFWYWGSGPTGAKVVGIDTPTGMTWVMCAIEIQAGISSINDSSDVSLSSAWSTRAKSLRGLSQTARSRGTIAGGVNATSVGVSEDFTYRPAFAVAVGGGAQYFIGSSAVVDAAVDIGSPIVKVDVAGTTVTVDLRS